MTIRRKRLVRIDLRALNPKASSITVHLRAINSQLRIHKTITVRTARRLLDASQITNFSTVVITAYTSTVVILAIRSTSVNMPLIRIEYRLKTTVSLTKARNDLTGSLSLYMLRKKTLTIQTQLAKQMAQILTTLNASGSVQKTKETLSRYRPQPRV